MTYLEEYQKHLRSNEAYLNSEVFVTIDPGARTDGGTGIACFKFDKNNPLIPKTYQTAVPVKEKDKIQYSLDQIETLLSPKIPISLYVPIFIEEPQYFDSYKGQMVASGGHLFKLIFYYGRLFQLLVSLNYKVIPVKISHWKGQLSKEQVSKRVEKICGKKYKGDVCDAVGIGLYLLGKF